jgi:HEAT repeat protein
MGREESVDALGRLLLDEQLVEPAAMALVAIKTGAAPVLCDALSETAGVCRRNIVDALAALEDPGSAEHFEAALDDGDVEVRIAARAGLSKVPELAAAEAILASAHNTSGWERIQTAKSCLIAAETLAGAGQAAASRQVYDRVIAIFDGEAEAHIRSAAEKGNAPAAP